MPQAVLRRKRPHGHATTLNTLWEALGLGACLAGGALWVQADPSAVLDGATALVVPAGGTVIAQAQLGVDAVHGALLVVRLLQPTTNNTVLNVTLHCALCGLLG